MNTRRPLTTAMLLLSLLLPLHAQTEAPDFRTKMEDALLADTLIASMSDEELLGQIYFIGYQGDEVPSYLLEWIKERNIGGIKIFTRNIKNLKAIAADIRLMQEATLKSRLKIPLFMATDQEGGWVRHIREETVHTPGNMAIGASDLPNDAYLTGLYMGRELSFIGINMNYAPTVDIYTNPENTGIGPRAFSSDPVTTGLMGVAFYKGMEQAGILCTAKHFPGHGDATEDSHGILPEVNINLETLENRELVPYKFLIKEGLPAIMTGHIAFPEITGETTAATLMPFFMKDVLREKLGFKGVLVTDSLWMNGVRKGISDFSEVTYRALMAGNDMLLIAHSKDNQAASWNRLIKQMKKEPALRARIEESVKRILMQKFRYFKGAIPAPVLPDVENVYRNLQFLQEYGSRDFNFQLSCRSVTLIRGEEFPYIPKKERILITGQYRDFIRQGQIRYPDADGYEFSYYPHAFTTDEIVQGVASRVRKYDTIIFGLANVNSFEVLEALKKYNKRIIVISTLTPLYLKDLPWIKTAIAIYGTSLESFKAGFAALSGDFIPTGKLPVEME